MILFISLQLRQFTVEILDGKRLVDDLFLFCCRNDAGIHQLKLMQAKNVFLLKEENENVWILAKCEKKPEKCKITCYTYLDKFVGAKSNFL